MTSASLADLHQFEWSESEADGLRWKERVVLAAAVIVVAAVAAAVAELAAPLLAAPAGLREQRPYW